MSEYTWEELHKECVLRYKALADFVDKLALPDNFKDSARYNFDTGYLWIEKGFLIKAIADKKESLPSNAVVDETVN